MREFLPDVPILALTASAPAKIVDDIKITLDLSSPVVVRASVDRPNIAIFVRRRTTQKEMIAGIMAAIYDGSASSLRVPCRTIIYTSTRRQSERFAQVFRGRGLEARSYHAGVAVKQKRILLKEWQEGVFVVMVATVAFGMGIDQSDVRLVVHVSLPVSMGRYLQEMGRAGRDGMPSKSLVFYNDNDAKILCRREGLKDVDRDAVSEVLTFCENKSDCRHVKLRAVFDGVPGAGKSLCGGCDVCDSKGTGVEEVNSDRKSTVRRSSTVGANRGGKFPCPKCGWATRIISSEVGAFLPFRGCTRYKSHNCKGKLPMLRTDWGRINSKKQSHFPALSFFKVNGGGSARIPVRRLRLGGS